ncbi:MAG TPA: Uma2 family endonuclease [Chthonomonadaceae bacterium]|nr:Uma2 family endonuclease [Chthonomonadaceae bacterium]
MVAQPIAPPSSLLATQQSSDASKVTVQEYLERERTSDSRHEYVDGEILAMAGETPEHNRIAGNIYRKLGNAFEERPCETFIENIRVWVTPTQYRYPDVVALCGEAQFDNERPPSLLNPSVIIEVLSPSTERFDRDEKFVEYRQLETVTDYVLVAQDEILVVHYTRVSPNQWTVIVYTSLTDTLTFTTLEVSLGLADIYRKIIFAGSESPGAEEGAGSAGE